ncbi:hypothetical protein HYH02_003777 [Chlamydomonas schloesseri]|uniref:Uncharacterized protein n=1 Tax=Chlamydomonas schloesseri TaxID=2026947 RepID=A0A835WR89_9CHLO|nr:hypothetical protein HYH02_003777 [Chlamydomonas schloesseri]|eukprot:KAG2451170.1 hypothetical protein HYH02_003777 [Chlamydomonas schloesseri]
MTAAIEEPTLREPAPVGADADGAAIELAACEATWATELSAAEAWDADEALRVAEEQAAEGVDEEFEDYSPKDWQRFYMGYHQRFVDDCVLELRGGALQVRLAQAPSASVAVKHAAKGAGAGGGGGGRAGGGPSAAAAGQGRGGKGGKGGGGGKAQQQQQQDLDKASDPALTGTTVWDGAVVLAHFLTETPVLAAPPPPPPPAPAPCPAAGDLNGDGSSGSAAAGPARALWPCSGAALPSVLELGAGTGGVSLALAATRTAASVTVTDLPDLLPTLRLNAGRNAALLPPGRLHVAPLKWGPEGEADVQALGPVPPPYDVIVGSDLIYYSYTPDTPHTELLLWTLRRLAAPATRVYLSLSLHHNPEEVEHFLGWAAKDFHVLRLRRSVPEDFRVADSLVVRLTPRRAQLVARRQQVERERLLQAREQERREREAREASAG